MRSVIQFWRDLSVRGKMLTGFLVPMGIMTSVSVAAYISIQKQINSKEWVTHTYEVIASANHLAKSMIDMETGQRGYLITGKENFLEPFDSARATWDDEITRLQHLVRDNPPQVRIIADVHDLQKEWLEKAARPAISERRNSSGDMTNVIRMIEKETGKNIVDRLRAKLQKFVRVEEDLIRTRVPAANRAAKRTMIVIIFGSLITLMTGLAMALLFSSYFLKQLRHLLAATGKTASGQTTKMQVESRDELGELQLAFNQMTDSLEKANSISSRHTKNLSRSNAKLSEANLKLKDAQRKAQIANEAKNVFLANMSHELRTPLTTIIGYGEMIQEEAREGGQEGFTSDAEKIVEAGTHLLNLIGDILDTSKIEAGKFDIKISHVETRPFLDSIAESAIILCTRGSNLFTPIFRDIPLTITTDSTRLRQILLNIIGNAAKFTKSGSITLTADQLDKDGREFIRFIVEDSGIGMAEENLERIFQKFTQVHDVRQDSIGGTGLGLPLTKQLVEMMEGTITVESQVDQGSKFTVVIPLEGTDHKAPGSGRKAS